jgi:RNA 3'-terminal phosphate cyclase (ATP)
VIAALDQDNSVLEIDGAQGSGSGTIVRFAVALSALLGRPLRLVNARQHRERPGLRPQHLAAVRACAALCGAETEGLAVGARDFSFIPGARICGGTYEWDIGTAGSATMIALSLLPIACLAEAPLIARLSGGVFQDFAPSPFHLQHVLAPLLGRMGATVELRLVRPGYIPQGGGIIELLVVPKRHGLTALDLQTRGAVSTVHGVALSSHLEQRRVSERMALSCQEELAAVGLTVEIERVHDTLAAQPGAGLAVWTESSTGCRLGADRSGAPGRSSEALGRFVAKRLLDELATDATVDRHAADQLVVFAALAHGVSNYVVPCRTNHLDGNLWLMRQFGVRADCMGRRVTIHGLGLQR